MNCSDLNPWNLKHLFNLRFVSFKLNMDVLFYETKPGICNGLKQCIDVAVSGICCSTIHFCVYLSQSICTSSLCIRFIFVEMNTTQINVAVWPKMKPSQVPKYFLWVVVLLDRKGNSGSHYLRKILRLLYIYWIVSDHIQIHRVKNLALEICAKSVVQIFNLHTCFEDLSSCY